MNINTLFHQTVNPWCFVDEHRHVHIKIKTGFDVKEVDLIYGDPHHYVKQNQTYSWSYQSKPMRQSQDRHSQYFNLTIDPPHHRLKYLFVIKTDQVYYYGSNRVTPVLEEDIWNYFFLPYVHPEMAYHPPHWVKDTMWYQIFPDRFHCDDGTQAWPTGKVTNLKHYGGNLKGIQQKLPYLAQLGINGLYLTPIFKAQSSHKYDTIDYFAIDPHFGSTQDLVDLVKQAHQLKIKVILDAVFNHTGAEFQFFKESQNKDSPYRDWFLWQTDHYETFSMVKNMPKLNTEHPEVIDYFCAVGEHWIKIADIDGWRLDVANEVSNSFWRVFRQRIKALKPEAYILGELWHDGSAWLNGDMFDGVMNYAFTDIISRFFLKQHSDFDTFKHEYLHYLNRYPAPLMPYQFNLLDSHDTDRVLSRANQNLSRVKQALALMLFSVGSPCIYYGTEIGLLGEMDPDNRRLMQFNPDPQAHELYQFIQAWIAIWKKLPEFKAIEDYQIIDHPSLFIIQHQNHQLIINLSEKDLAFSNPHTLLYPNNYEGNLAAQAILLIKLN
jgi:cyclomaltodextrinase / maltogenic alpha-amylase / neopullulanase